MWTRGRWSRVGLAPFLALMLAGCGVIIIDSTTGHDELNGAIRDTAAEINLHYANVHAAPTVVEARAEVERHRAAMVAHDRDLGRHIHAMICVGGGADDMMGLMASVDARVDVYVAQAMTAPTVTDLLALCLAYADELDRLFDRMDDQADRLGCED